MNGQGDVGTVAGSDVATFADAPQPDITHERVSPMGPTTAGIIGREILGQYRVISKLGRGGMGTVFLAEQPGMNRQVAIKVLHADVSSEPDAARRFQVEAEAAARLASPHIVSVYNFGRLESGELYLAMEFLQGRTLQAELATYGRLALEQVVDLVQQIARGLDEAHRKGVIHRDLKPGNIMVVRGADGDVAKLLDFGIAKLDAGSGTQTRGWVGTPRYMAPEQFTGAAIDARTDIYALGLITYEMLCGRTPFVSDNPMSYVHSHVYSAVPSLQELVPGMVPPAVERVVLSALAKDPGGRPHSASAFADALRASLHTAPRAPEDPSVLPIVLAAGLGVAAVAGLGWWALSQWGTSGADVDVPSPEAAVEPDSSGAPPAAEPGLHVPQVPADEGFDPAYVATLPEAFKALVDLDEVELLKRLDARMSVYPPSMRSQIRGQYTLQLAAMPREPATPRRAMLINAIVGMDTAQKYLPEDPRTTKELVADYLSRPGPIPRASRQEIIDNMRAAVREEADRDWTVRQWLISLEEHESKTESDGA
ncbi:MAG: serine/threonine protein kinase [Nannocystales bacterium]